MTAATIEIDCCHLRLTGVEPADARRLAQLVAAGLVPSLRLGPGEASLGCLQIEVQARPGDGSAELAGRIVERLAPLINRMHAIEAGR
jgi:hypothetical protein